MYYSEEVKRKSHSEVRWGFSRTEGSVYSGFSSSFWLFFPICKHGGKKTATNVGLPENENGNGKKKRVQRGREKERKCNVRHTHRISTIRVRMGFILPCGLQSVKFANKVAHVYSLRVVKMFFLPSLAYCDIVLAYIVGDFGSQEFVYSFGYNLLFGSLCIFEQKPGS